VDAITLDILDGLEAATVLRGDAWREAGMRAFLDAAERAQDRHGEEEGIRLAREATRRLCPLLRKGLELARSR
jgi:hypothetical protein